ncbi:50S ribosomal protein L2 [Ignisphaera sp. 4213-co]|uniref:Large ribosomal subunit protein uL2 n=1 Tax=Ignisphaera cupida TaxID=3050454 RepID=A0ABD4Z5E6_9CREN|nr:50S ribosomal protein L2 [Ignisphaera sp. 4213-co]MDK6027979.1 50S ribosomal protein L2 [Ignisphaera sp. 4213-co]
MGKRILVQRMGRGGQQFRSPKHKKIAPVKYPYLPPDKTLKGIVVDIIHEPGRSAPIALIKLENGEEFYNVAVEGLRVGQVIEIGSGASIANGNIVPLRNVPEGARVCNVELRPYDGGKLVRSGGSYAIVTGKTSTHAILTLPSGKQKTVLLDARATIGMVAGGGRLEKPLLKAGNAYYKWRAKARKWPRVRGVAMNAVDHPHGGGSHQSESKPTTISRRAPPGRKVGHISAKRTGRKKGAH